jgi:hypothetical protein
MSSFERAMALGAVPAERLTFAYDFAIHRILRTTLED